MMRQRCGHAGRRVWRASRPELAVRELALFPMVGQPVRAGEGEACQVYWKLGGGIEFTATIQPDT